MKKQDLINFIQNRLNDPNFDGCYYYDLGKDLYLVFARNENDDLDCKVAYNCDDLQYDYDWDWYMPETKDGDLIGQDWTDVIESGWTATELAEEVIDSYNYVIGCGWKKPRNDD